MPKIIRLAVLFLFTCAGWAQVVADPSHSRPVPVWQPPTLQLPDGLLRATIPKPMAGSLIVGKIPIILEETKLADAQKLLGGTFGHRGDAGDALEWLCFYGDDVDGRWVLWLESDEVGSGMVNGFALQRIGGNAKVDRRCRMLRKDNGEVELPVSLRLGMTQMQVHRALGEASLKYRNILIFDHEHAETIHKEPYTVSNTVYIVLRKGAAWSIQVWKITVS